MRALVHACAVAAVVCHKILPVVVGSSSIVTEKEGSCVRESAKTLEGRLDTQVCVCRVLFLFCSCEMNKSTGTIPTSSSKRLPSEHRRSTESSQNLEVCMLDGIPVYMCGILGHIRRYIYSGKARNFVYPKKHPWHVPHDREAPDSTDESSNRLHPR